MVAKLYATHKIGGDIDLEIAGNVNSKNEEITITLTHDITKEFKYRLLYYEIVLFKEDKSYVKNISNGRLLINKETINNPAFR